SREAELDREPGRRCAGRRGAARGRGMRPPAERSRRNRADFTSGLHREYPGLNRGTEYVNRMSDRLSTFARAVRLPVVALLAMLARPVGSPGSAAKVAPPRAARDLAQTYFAGQLTRAEVVTVSGKYEHDWRVDEGRVVAVRQNAIDLMERDGTRQTIAIGPS